jgi:hypothetical protein
VDNLPLVVLAAHSDEVDPFQLGGKHQPAPNTLVLLVFFYILLGEAGVASLHYTNKMVPPLECLYLSMRGKCNNV